MEEQSEQVEEVKEYALKEPLIVHNGECEHYYEFIETDPEGIKNYQCKHCIMGKRLRDEWEVIDGVICTVQGS